MDNQSLARLASASAHVRRDALEELAKQIEIIERVDIANLLKQFASDHDRRVRKTSLQLLQRNIEHVSGEDMVRLRTLLADDSEDVRYEALGLFHAYAMEHPEEEVANLVFLATCEMVNDVCVRNRAKACELLGTLPSVKTGILVQTVSKESIGAAGEDAVPWSACGAFIHGLEDEFEAVRCAAIRSMFTLALCSKEFAAKATDYIVDAFNDESDSVRLLAVRTLHGICLVHRVLLELEHLESTLCLLDDLQSELRGAARSLLQVAYLANEEGLGRTIRCVTQALAKRPEDLGTGLPTLAKMGTNNPELVGRLLPSLLKIERFFLTAEPRVEDFAHCCKLIVVLNALAESPELHVQLPLYVYSHWRYVRAKYPDSLPDFQRTEQLRHLFFRSAPMAAGEPACTSASLFLRLNAILRLSTDSPASGRTAALTMLQNIAFVRRRFPHLDIHCKLLRELLQCLVLALGLVHTGYPPQRFALVCKCLKVRHRFWPLDPAVSLFLDQISALNIVPLEIGGSVDDTLRYTVATICAPQRHSADKPLRGLAMFPLAILVSAELLDFNPDSSVCIAIQGPDRRIFVRPVRPSPDLLSPVWRLADQKLYIHSADTSQPGLARVWVVIQLAARDDLVANPSTDEAAFFQSFVPLGKPLEFYVHFK